MVSRHYRTEPLGEGVYAAIERPDGGAICNSGLVRLGDERFVFDTGLTPNSADDLKSEAQRVLGGPVSLAANSHWHVDHSFGNPAFAGIPIWATRRTREVLLELTDTLTAELAQDRLAKSIEDLESQSDRMRSEGARSDLEFLLRINRALRDAANRLRVAPPDRTFETKLELPGRPGAELFSFGGGHTQADALCLLREERVMFAGDLVCVGIQPSMESGNPADWLRILDRIEAWSPERIVPGHGPVSGQAGIDETRAYVAGVLEAARMSKGATLPAGVRRWEGSLGLEQNLSFARGWLAEHESRR